MAKVAATDALFMANVAQVNAIENSKKLQAEGISFAQTMGDAGKQNLQADKSADSMTVASSGRTTVKTNRNPVEDKSKSESPVDKNGTDKMGAAAEKTLKKAEGIREEIKDAFDVSDEEIAEAMEVLGLSMQNLLDPESLKELMINLSGCEDSLELLTNADLYEDMQNILSDALESVSEIASEFGFTTDEVNALLEDNNLFDQIAMKENDFEIRNEAFGPILENEAFQAEAPEIAPGDKDSLRNDEVKQPDKRIEVEITKDSQINSVSDQSKTDSFKNITQTEQSNNEGMMNMPSQTTTVTVNELGEVVETVERFSNAFSDANEIVSQVTQTIKLSVSSDTTSMEMMLHPASLGTVNMQISSQNGVVTAHLFVQDEAVKSALESQLAVLQETFEEQGKTVEAVEVSVANYDLNRGMQQHMHDEQERENAFRMGKSARRRLRLDDMSDEDIEELDESEQIAADMMKRQGNSLDYMA